MKIAANTVAAFDYTLTNAKGEVLDSSQEAQPLEYLHGAGNIITGLESALEGLSAGDEKQVVLQPADAYGEHEPSLVVSVPRSRFETGDTIEIGMRFHAQTPEGIRVVAVRAINGDTVTLDGNHPLSGEVLHFSVKVVSVREATPDEISHGHPHHECGCGHDHHEHHEHHEHGECGHHHHDHHDHHEHGECGHHHGGEGCCHGHGK
ncbi:MAG: peptidylprolyl isomerase [Puniceicoccales bacterium]|jgi:FKBP-type peptidyl-prolyl cis-trans isomerase SlyD|nr:peptidylprolyl isomerase [Puniceicoccales bacterium]